MSHPDNHWGTGRVQANVTPPVLLVVANFSQFPKAIDWGRDRLVELFGPVALASEPFSFHHTTYYQSTMGEGLRKQFFAFENLVPEDFLVQAKHQTNALEKELAETGEYPIERPLNLDPGILTLGKFLLASTKDQCHRIYLTRGIYAEITLKFQHGSFQPWEWTYADYREPALHDYLKQARDYYRSRLAEYHAQANQQNPG